MERLKPSWIALALVLAILAAGCSSKGQPKDQPGASLDPTASPMDPTTATSGLKGFVTDDEGLPVPDALVVIQPPGLTATTQADGSYDSGPVPPGSAHVEASKIGYIGQGFDVLLPDGQVAMRNFSFTRVNVGEGRHVIIGPYTGYFQCRWGTPGGNGNCGYVHVNAVNTGPIVDPLYTQDKNKMTFKLEPGANWEEIVIEAKWTPTSIATTPKLTVGLSYEGGSDMHFFARSEPSANYARLVCYDREAGSPGQTVIAAEPKRPDANQTLVARMYVPYGSSISPEDLRFVAVAYDLKFDIWATVFYNQAAPEGYSVFAT